MLTTFSQYCPHHGIMQCRAERFDLVVISPRMYAIAEEDDMDLLPQINPHRGPSKSQVTHRMRRKETSRARVVRRGSIPSQRPSGAGNFSIACPKFLDYGRRYKRVFFPVTRDEAAHQAVHIINRGKHAGMTRDTAHGVGIVIMHFRTEYSFAPRTPLGRSKPFLA